MFSENDTGGGDADGSKMFPGSGGVTLARFDRPRGSGTTVAVVSDPHVTPTARGSMKLYHRTKQRFEMAVADAHRLDVDGVVVAGDLTKDGTQNEYMLGDSLVGTLPDPTVAVPGNHDVGPAQALGSGTAFARRYGHGEYPVTERMGEVTVCGIDSTCPGVDRHGGGVGREPLSTLIDTPTSGGRIAVMHHPLAPVPGPFDTVLPETDYRIRDPETTADALVDAGVELVVTGHLHWPFATTYRGLNVVGAPGCSTFPPSYLLVHVDSSGTTVSLVPLVGEQGLAEAYEFAVADDSRGSLVRRVVEDGYFGGFPQVDQQRASGWGQRGHNEHPPTPGEHTGSRTPPGRSG